MFCPLINEERNKISFSPFSLILLVSLALLCLPCPPSLISTYQLEVGRLLIGGLAMKK
jgi:hypothetical protein